MFITKNNKSRYFQLVYFVDGKRTTISTKTEDEKQANEFLFKFKYNLVKNPQKIVSQKETPTFEQQITLTQYMSEYLNHIKPIKSPRYITSISLSFRQLILFCGDIQLNAVNSKTVDQFITFTFARTQRGSHLYYRTLKAAFNKAIGWGYISFNPFTKVKFPKVPKSFPAFISVDEFLIILTNCKHQFLRDIFIVAFYTGLRISEILNMKWHWINFFQNQITVKCSEDFITKNKKERIIPMSEKVKNIISHRFNSASHNQQEFVFYQKRGVKLLPNFVSKQFKYSIRKSNLSEKIHFHSLRHSFASLLAQKGVSLYIIKELLGHEDLTTTQIYSHLCNKNFHEAINQLNIRR